MEMLEKIQWRLGLFFYKCSLFNLRELFSLWPKVKYLQGTAIIFLSDLTRMTNYFDVFQCQIIMCIWHLAVCLIAESAFIFSLDLSLNENHLTRMNYFFSCLTLQLKAGGRFVQTVKVKERSLQVGWGPSCLHAPHSAHVYRCAT